MENYLSEARRRFELDLESKRRQREEREEAEERTKREIYLNGGYRDCATPGCDGRAAAPVAKAKEAATAAAAAGEGEDEDEEASYLCG